MSQRPPLRLRDDPAAPRALRDDLARAAAHTPYDVAAGLARFERALAAGAGAASTGAASGAGGATVIGAAVKGALLGIAVIGGAVVMDARAPAPAPVRSEAWPAASAVTEPPRAAASTAAPQAPDAPPEPSLSPRPKGAPVTMGGDPPYPPPVSVVTKPPAPVVADSAPAEGPSVVPSSPRTPALGSALDAGDALAAEVEHLARLRAVAGRDPAQALALATEGDQRFGSGLFAQEREAIAIAALVRLGRATEARSRAHVFLARYPRSSFAERIQEMIRSSEAK